MTCNNSSNFTKFSTASIRLHSSEIVGLNFCYPPTSCHWTTPAAPSGLAQIDLNNIIDLWVVPVLALLELLASISVTIPHLAVSDCTQKYLKNIADPKSFLCGQAISSYHKKFSVQFGGFRFYNFTMSYHQQLLKPHQLIPFLRPAA